MSMREEQKTELENEVNNKQTKTETYQHMVTLQFIHFFGHSIYNVIHI